MKGFVALRASSIKIGGRRLVATAPRADEMGRVPLVSVAGGESRKGMISRGDGDAFITV